MTALSNEGVLHNRVVVQLLYGLLKYVTPLLILLVMLKGLGLL